jgi:hypothetical protein
MFAHVGQTVSPRERTTSLTRTTPMTSNRWGFVGGTGISQTASPKSMMPIVQLGEGVRSHEELLSGRSLDVFVERIGTEHAGE